MADDTRDPTISRSSSLSSSSNPPKPPRGPPPGEIAPPAHVSTPPKIYEVFHGSSASPPQSANALPEGSGQNTAGSASKEKPPTLGDAVKTVHWQDFKQVHMYPCVRESLLMGIGGGFGVGGVRALWGAGIPKAANWAVGTFVFAAFANYEFCLYRRRLERAHMKRAVEIIDRKKLEKEEAARVKREERRRLKEEADKKAEEDAKRKSWKFW